MDRRNFLKSVTGVATAVAAGTATANAANHASASEIAAPKTLSGRRQLHLAMAWPDNTQGAGDFLQQFSARVLAATEGTLSIEVVDQTDAGPDAARRGTLECYCASEHNLRDVAPELAFFAGLPGQTAMGPQTLHNWITVGGGQQLWDQVSADLGLKALAIANTGPVSGLWSRAPIDSLPELAGKTIFAEGLAGDVVKAIGGEAFAGDRQSVSMGLANSTIFAVETGNVPTALAAGLVHEARFVSTPGINGSGSVVAFGIGKATWDALTASERAVLESAAAATYQETLAFTQSQHKLMMAACETQYQVRQRELGQDVRSAINSVSDIVIAHLAASSPKAERINASYMAFRNASGLEA